jgi:hypothetical protein
MLSFQASQEAESERITSPDQPRQNFVEPHLDEKKKKKLGMVACACHPNKKSKFKIGKSKSTLG